MPHDAQPVSQRVYSHDIYVVGVDTYSSPSLALVFKSPDQWNSGKPGTINVEYALFGPKLDEVLNFGISLGKQGPILKEFAEHVGGEHVHVTSLITGFESEHSYSPKPSDLRVINEARLLLEIGLGLEVWVQGLVKNAGSPGLRVVTTSRDISIIRDAEDADSQGNPHIWLDPENAKIIMLGSCGGYKNLKTILTYAPEAHIISTKQKSRHTDNCRGRKIGCLPRHPQAYTLESP